MPALAFKAFSKAFFFSLFFFSRLFGVRNVSERNSFPKYEMFRNATPSRNQAFSELDNRRAVSERFFFRVGTCSGGGKIFRNPGARWPPGPAKAAPTRLRPSSLLAAGAGRVARVPPARRLRPGVGSRAGGRGSPSRRGAFRRRLAAHFAGAWPALGESRLCRHWPNDWASRVWRGRASGEVARFPRCPAPGGGLSQVAPLPSQPSYGLPGNHPRRAWTGLVWTRKNGGGGQRKRRWHPLRGALVPMWHTSSDAPTSQEHDPRQVPCLRAHTPRRLGGALLRGAPPLGGLGAERLPTGAARNLWTGRPLQAAPGNARARETPPPPTPRAPARLRSSLPAHSLPPRARARIFFFFQWPHSLLGSRNTFCVFPDRFPFPALKHPSS